MVLVIFFNRKAKVEISFIKSFITKPSANNCLCLVPVMCLMRCLTLSFGFPSMHRKIEGIDMSFGWIIFLLFIYIGLLHRAVFDFPLQMLPTSEKL